MRAPSEEMRSRAWVREASSMSRRASCAYPCTEASGVRSSCEASATN